MVGRAKTYFNLIPMTTKTHDLRTLRRMHDLTQADVAARVGCSKATDSLVERNLYPGRAQRHYAECITRVLFQLEKQR